MAWEWKKSIWKTLWGSFDLNFPIRSISTRLALAFLLRKLPGKPEEIAPGIDFSKDPEALQKALNKFDSEMFKADEKSALKDIVSPLLAILPAVSVLMEMGRIQYERPWLQPWRKLHEPTLPGVAEIIEFWRRDPEYKEKRDDRIGKLGYSPDDIKRLVDISWAIPGVADIIRFAVREVYTPSIIEEYQLRTGIEEVKTTAKEDLSKAGVSPDLLDKHWMSHWELPGLRDAFEMFHRGEIETRDELKKLLRVKDVMPIWQDKLINIAYSPFTRVDIRRMQKYGILDTRLKVVTAYKDIGYSPTNAEIMTDFTYAYNASPESSEETFDDREAGKQRDLSKAEILKAFRDGLLDETKTDTALKGMGYTKEEREYLLSWETFKIGVAELRKHLTYLKKAFLDGIIDRTELIVKLGAFNLPAKYQERIVEDLELDKSLKYATPSKAEILRWYSKKMLEKGPAEKELKRMGYSDFYIKIYLEEKAPKE